MNLDRHIESWQKSTDQVNWDPVTERRVLMKVLAFRKDVRSAVSRPRLLAAAAMIAAAAALVIAGLFALGDESAIESRTDLSPSVQGSIAAAGTSQIRFLDGSTATYLTVAEVEVEEQSSSAVKLWHKHGEVRYRVEKASSREFLVNACGVEIRVVGTVFVVKVSGSDVRVRVEQGVVTVDSGSGVVQLTAGEEISLAGREGGTEIASPDHTREAPMLTGTSGVGESGSAMGGRTRGSAGDRSDDNVSSFAQLMREVDRARKLGDNVRAAGQLRKLVTLYPGDGRVVSVLFTLGKVESHRGRYVEAARAFRKCWRSAPRGTLAEDAHYQEAISWERIGRLREAGKAAGRYLEKFPNGPYADRMRRISE